MLENMPLKYLWILLGLAIMSMELFAPGFIIVFFGRNTSICFSFSWDSTFFS